MQVSRKVDDSPDAKIADDPAAGDSAADDNPLVVYDWDIASDVIRWGPNLATLTGIDDCEPLTTGLGYAEHLAAESPSSRYEAIMASEGCDTGGGVAFKTVYGLLPAKRSTAKPIWIEDAGRWFADGCDRPCRAHGTIRVITERYEAERLRTACAQRDPITGAFNRAHFVEHLGRQLSLAARKSSTFAVLVIGLELVGGDAMNDELLARAVETLGRDMRGHELLARHGTARFAALLENCTPEQAAAAGGRFLATLESTPGATGLQARIGAVMAPYHGRTPQALLQFAEEALEIARQPEAPRFVVYHPDLAKPAPTPAAVQSDTLLAALNENRIALALQPVVAAKTRAVAFYEGLVRVRAADGKLVLPDRLVPEAERSGLVPLIDRRVIDLAFSLLTSDRKLALSINAAVASLQDPAWTDHLRACCKLRPDAARRLTVEITETCVIADPVATGRMLAEIKPLGVKIAIDDFGSGHSSFRNLRELPIDYLKIDGAFAQHLASSQDDRFFIRTLIDLARNLRIPTVVEWVEDEATAKLLADWGVDYLQGHLFGKAEMATMPTPKVRPTV